MNTYSKMAVVLTIFTLSACGTSSKVTSYRKSTHGKYANTNTTKPNSNSSSNKSNEVLRSINRAFTSKDAENVLKTAKSYIGVPYKYGGASSSGFDCSGLVMVSFDQLGFKLPRNSSQQASFGNEIKVNEVRKGDLIFFNTSGSSISHVGIVDSIEKDGEIKFIHSSTSKGVIISSLDENYWKTRFVKAVRLL